MVITHNQIYRYNKDVLKSIPKTKRTLAVNYAKNVINSKINKNIFDTYIVYIP